MEFMLILLVDREAPEDPTLYPEMGRFAGELASRGQLRGGAPLQSEAQGVRVTGSLLHVGPFPSRVVIGGYFVIECKSRAEAIAIARRCPHTRVGTVEVRQLVAMRPPPSARRRPRGKPPRKIAGKKKKAPARRKKR